MDETTDRTAIRELFEKHRATPGSPYDEQHFLDFLLTNPKKPGAVYDSFRGLRRLHALIDEVQLEFGVCFSKRDLDANYSLPRFVERVAELRSSPRGSLRSLNNQVREGVEWFVPATANLALLVVGLWFRERGWGVTVVVAAAVLFNLWFVWFVWKGKAYQERLRARIEEEAREP